MIDEQHNSWLTRLYECVRRTIVAPSDVDGHRPPAELAPIRDRTPVAAAVGDDLQGVPRSLEHWRDLLHQGRRVVMSWDGGPELGAMLAEGEVRLTFDETVWVWLEQDLPEDGRPELGQAMQVMTPCHDALRVIPCRLVEGGHGSSLQVEVSGRTSRLQRRDDVRARVDLPPISAVQLDDAGRPVGLRGLRLIDLSAGGLRALSTEPLSAGDRLRLVLRLDDDAPITPIVEVLIGGLAIQGHFGPLPERDRRRIVQFVYRQELAERRRRQADRDQQAAEGME